VRQASVCSRFIFTPDASSCNALAGTASATASIGFTIGAIHKSGLWRARRISERKLAVAGGFLRLQLMSTPRFQSAHGRRWLAANRACVWRHLHTVCSVAAELVNDRRPNCFYVTANVRTPFTPAQAASFLHFGPIFRARKAHSGKVRPPAQPPA
jgi:hypothetical protein